METVSVSIAGLPASINNAKLKPLIERRVGSPKCVKSVKREKDRFVCTFHDREGLQKFLNADIKDIEFGHKLYQVEIFKPDFTTEVPPHSQLPLKTTQVVHEQEKFSEELQEKLYENKHSWSSFEHLPAPGGTICLLAHNIDPSTTIQKIIMHFGSKKRAGGGPVAGIVNMIDGLLVVFMKADDCESSINTTQKFEDRNLRIFRKKIPDYYERKFAVEGVGQRTTEDTLTMFLENCTRGEVTPESCKKQEVPGVYLVEYGGDFDTSEMDEFLQKIKSNELEGNHLQAKRLLKTDCLKVSGVPKNVSNDQIRLVLESTKRSGGGPVTRIDRLAKDSALVYFSLVEDAERVCKKGSVIINQRPATVNLYHHSLERDHEKVLQDYQPELSTKSEPAKDGQKQALQTFEFEPKCGEKLIDFIFARDKHLQMLQADFEKLATVEVIKPAEKDQPKRLKFKPKKVLTNKSQDEFQKSCETSFESHVAKYSQSRQSFDSIKLGKARGLKLYPRIEISYTGTEINDDVEVSWKPNDPIVEVIGITETVDHMMQDIAKCINSTVAKKTFGESQFGVLIHCGIICHLREKYSPVQMKCDSSDFSVTFIGQDSDINAAQIDALSAMLIEKKKISGLDEDVLKFLCESMQKSGEITSKLQGDLNQDSIKAFIFLDDNEPCIKAKTSEDFRKAMEVIRQRITLDVIKTDDAKSKVLESPKWTAFQRTHSDNGLCKIYVKPDGNIVLVGILSETKVIRAKIKSFLDENAIQRIFINAQYGKARFVIERAKEFSKDMCRKKEITCGISAEDNGGVFLEGKRKALDSADQEIRKLLRSLIEDTFTLEKPGIKEYYSSKSGKLFLAKTEHDCNCIILTELRDNPEWLEYNEKHGLHAHSKSRRFPVDLREEDLLSVTLPHSSVTLSVWKTDISKHKCDVIVNATNESLKLLPTGVSGIIKGYDDRNGKQIQNEMDDHTKRNYGGILAGEAVMTSAGNLPHCKKIVHACGPRWLSPSSSEDPKLILKACISRSLENMEEDHLKSIAIPAISCGVFGGKVPVCIPLILEAVEEYFQDNSDSHIEEVHFVENTKQDVLDEFVHYLKKYKPSNKAKPTTNKTPVKFASTAAPSNQASSLLQGSCTVIIIHGDIAEQKADVIVNVTDPGNLPKMMSGPVISKVLGAKAGPSVQKEVSLIPGPHNIGDVFETSAGSLSCKKLYHALVTHYNHGQAQACESVIQTVVGNSLEMADKAGYKSIVFPAIATGGFRYPPDSVAKIMRQEIVNFAGNSIREVIILLHPQNPSTIQAFEAEFNSTTPIKPPSPTPATRRISFKPTKYKESHSPQVEKGRKSRSHKEKPKKMSANSAFEKVDDSSASFGKVLVTIEEGDITEQDCDVIVNSTNDSFNLDQGMVSKQILKKGGQIIQDEATESRGGKNRDRDIAVTTGGNLQCRKIIHLVTPTDPKDLQKKIIKVLNKVEELKLKHVCMPAFGTGNLRMAEDEVGSIMQASIEQFVKSRSSLKHLEEVTIVIFDSAILENFRTGFFTPKKGFLERVLGGWWDYLTSSQQEAGEEEWEHVPQSATSLTMFFYSTNQSDIQQAKDFVGNEVKKVIDRAVIEDNSIKRLTDWEVHDIQKSGEKHNVQITDKSSRYFSRLILDGLTHDVMKAREEIKDILREFSAAETCAVYVLWQKKISKGKWEDYHQRASHILEKAYKEITSGRGQYAPSKIRVQEFCDGKVSEHVVDLSLLDASQKGKSPQVRRKIREKSATDIPDFWDDMMNQPFVTVPLTQGSQEYQNVLTKFQTSANVFYQSIISVERVQNVSLYKQYAAKKAEVTEKLKNYNGLIERDLFYSTPGDDKIVQDGFDRSWCRQVQSVANMQYGQGVYFTTDPGVSHNYAQPDAQGHRKMFLTNVIVGEFCVGQQTTFAPPIKPNSSIKNDIFDSTVDNVSNPTIFVIYKDASAYPAYRVTYT